MIFNMYSFTRFIVFVTAPFLFNKQYRLSIPTCINVLCTVHCLPVFAWYPALFIFT